MEKEIYTPQEKYLIEAMKAYEERKAALEVKKQTTSLLELDELLLKMEAQADMMDGIKMEEWLL